MLLEWLILQIATGNKAHLTPEELDRDPSVFLSRLRKVSS